MIYVKKPNIDEDDWKRKWGAEWDDLIAEARNRRRKLIEDYDSDKEIEIDQDLYKRFMKFLLQLFNGKCAYCEAKITTNQPGDVEHFRPKGRVVDENFRPIKVRDKNRGEINHPGYYWLSYDWANLLPSCIDCNRYRKLGSPVHPVVNKADAGAGKADRFPLEDETMRAHIPDHERNEKALLINPSEVDPAEHLEFLSNGSIVPKSPLGEATLKVFGLNSREDLLEARADAFGNALAIFGEWLNNIDKSPEQRKVYARRVNRMWLGAEAYSALHRRAISQKIEAYQQSNVDIRLPLPE